MAEPVIFSEEWCELVRPWLNADEEYRKATAGLDMRFWLIVMECPDNVDKFVEHEWKDGELVTFRVSERAAPDPEWRRLEFTGGYRPVAPEVDSTLAGLPRIEYEGEWWGGISGTYHLCCDLYRVSGRNPKQATLFLRQAYYDPRFRLDQRAVECDRYSKQLQGHFDGCARANKNLAVQFPEHSPGGGPTFFQTFKAEPQVGPRIFTPAWSDLVRVWLNGNEECRRKMSDTNVRLWFVICNCPRGVDIFVENDWRKKLLVSQTLWERPAGDYEWRGLDFEKGGWLGGWTGSWQLFCDMHYPNDEEPAKASEEILETTYDPRGRLDLPYHLLYQHQIHLRNYFNFQARAVKEFNIQVPDRIPRGGPTLAEIFEKEVVPI